MIIGFGINALAADSPSYRGNILPILQKYCSACHGSGSDIGDVTDYATAFGMKESIFNTVTVDKSMPMGSAGKKITEDERNLIGQWVATGAAE